MSAVVADVLGAAAGLGVNLLSIGAPRYAVVSADTAALMLNPDTVLELEYRHEYRISDYPVEQGAFSSYNKVAVPYDLRVKMSWGGQNFVQDIEQVIDELLNTALGTGFGQPQGRGDALAAIETMLGSLDLYDVVTPDYTYTDCNLVHMDYRKTAKEGAVRLVVDLFFREIRETVSAIYSNGSLPNVFSNSPSAANPVSLGTVTGSAPTVAESALIGGGSFV